MQKSYQNGDMVLLRQHEPILALLGTLFLII